MSLPAGDTTATLRNILTRVEAIRSDVAGMATTHDVLERRVALLELAGLHHSTDLIVACDCGTPVRVAAGDLDTPTTCANCATSS